MINNKFKHYTTHNLIIMLQEKYELMEKSTFISRDLRNKYQSEFCFIKAELIKRGENVDRL